MIFFKLYTAINNKIMEDKITFEIFLEQTEIIRNSLADGNIWHFEITAKFFR